KDLYLISLIDMFFSEALFDAFNTSKKMAISRQELYNLFLKIWTEKEYKGIKISDLRYNSKHYKKKFRSVLQDLKSHPQLKSIGEEAYGPTYFINLNKSPLNVYQIICDIYPAGYISHLSAMEFHRLTPPRNLQSIFFTTIDRKSWKEFFYNVIVEINYPFFSDTYQHDLLDLIPRFPTEEKYLDQDLIVFTTKNLHGFENQNNLRVRQLPFLFLDMVRTPQYCGGVETVLRVFRKYANLLLEDILEICQTHGTNIDKARVGFILDEVLKIQHPIIDKWKTLMVGQRGGSRKFVAYLAFEPRFSETWNISLNHTSVNMYGKVLPPS
uniref:hypothetical protein n=1 Tax=Acinetobacter radioresistens TaxID=40216 RepID=UPI000B084ADF